MMEKEDLEVEWVHKDHRDAQDIPVRPVDHKDHKVALVSKGHRVSKGHKDVQDPKAPEGKPVHPVVKVYPASMVRLVPRDLAEFRDLKDQLAHRESRVHVDVLVAKQVTPAIPAIPDPSDLPVVKDHLVIPDIPAIPDLRVWVDL